MKILFASNGRKVLISGIVVGLILLIFDPSLSLGFWIGMAISELYLNLINAFYAYILGERHYSRTQGVLLFVGRILILSLPFVLAYKFPDRVNLFAALGGLLYFKVVLYVVHLFFRKKGAA
jgi:hypothetical protein